MAVISKLDYNGQDTTKYNNATISNISFNGVDYHFAKPNEVADGVCENAVNEPIIDMQIYGNSTQRLLPKEYQEVTYIESSGTQYIDTGFAPNQDTRIIVDFQLTKLTSAFICGARESASSKAYTLNMGMVSGKCQLRSIYGSQTHMLSGDFQTERCVIDKNGAVVYMNNEYKVTHSSTNFTAPGSLYIFACNQANTAGGYLPDEMKLYSFKMYDNGTLIRNYVPCYRTADSVAGLYDIVNDKFYTNAGTGTFIVGADVLPTPDTPIEIQSVGDKTKNLFDVSNEAGWGIDLSLGTYYYYPIYVGANKTVTVSWDNDLTLGQGFYLVFGYQSSHKGTANGVWLYHSTVESICKKSINVTADEEGYIYINMSPKRLNVLSKLQIEYGTTATEYEPYGYKVPVKISGNNIEPTTTNIYLKEPLRKIDDVVDVLDYKNKKVVRNILKRYLIDMTYSIQNIEVTNGYRAGFFSTVPTTMLKGSALAGFSNILPANNGGWSSMNSENIRFGQNNTALYVYTTNTYESKEDLLNYLGNGDVAVPYVVYILETPTEETIEVPELNTYDGTTTLDIETTIEPNEIKINYWKQI